ncbi:MAG: DNA-binding protein WhiA [Ruminococcaceae bacterium]|nr:DNA-binding protein WhiA [Oscillospiraceae bacterium]
MKKDSFSSSVKEHLHEVPRKKKCCQHAFKDGCVIYNGSLSPATLVQKGLSGLVCHDCLSSFLAGLFVASGNISDPDKSYHLEFSIPDDDTADAISEVLTEAGFDAGRTIRKGRVILYFKNSTVIEDILGFIGASSGAFELMNAKIVREMRENTNRQVNCDAANISKTLSASERYIKVIDELKECGLFNSLTGDLKETAEMRTKFPDISIAELGQKFSPPISKSGVKHRLDKIIDFYESKNKEHTN